MKLSEDTVNVLKNFSGINQSLQFKVGNTLKTISPLKTIFVEATVNESFPQEFAIYDLNQLLSLISVSQNPDIEFNEKSLTIRSENGGELEYFYADESLVTAPSENAPSLEDIYTFKLTAGDINTVIKTASIVSATMLNIISEKGKVTLTVNDPKNSTSHSYKLPLGENDQVFNVKMNIDSFKVVPDDYNVRVAHAVAKSGKVLVFFFECLNRDLTYLIAADTTSKV